MIFLLITLLLRGSFLTPAKLTVVVKNIEVSKGSVVLAVFNNENSFLKKPAAQQVIKASSGIVEFSFSLPEGDYAVAIYQDVNDNRKLDKNWLGIPKEPYGFSNNFRPKFSAPGFNDCKFTITRLTTTTIVLK